MTWFLRVGLLLYPFEIIHALECSILHFDWLTKKCERGVQAYREGDPQLLVSGYSYHHRGTYTKERLAELNEKAWGLGYAQGITDERGDDHLVYALIFRDSHFKYQKMIGYGYQTYWGNELKAGLGFTAFLVSRPDIYNNVPIPGVLPLVSIKYKNAQALATVIPKVDPKSTGNGNVAFIFGRISFR